MPPINKRSLHRVGISFKSGALIEIAAFATSTEIPTQY